MGFQSTLYINNDALDDIGEDPEFGKKVRDAVLKSVFDKPVDIHGLHYSNVATVIECHHANQTAIVAMGGCYGNVIGTVSGGNLNLHDGTDESKVAVLKDLAESLGYTLHKKPIRK